MQYTKTGTTAKTMQPNSRRKPLNKTTQGKNKGYIFFEMVKLFEQAEEQLVAG